MYFPRLLISLSSLGSGLIDLLVALAVMLAMMAWFGIAPTWQMALLPMAVALTAADRLRRRLGAGGDVRALP